MHVTAWSDWLEAVAEISGKLGLGRELVANIDHWRDGHKVFSRRGVGQSVCHMIIIVADGQGESQPPATVLITGFGRGISFEDGEVSTAI